MTYTTDSSVTSIEGKHVVFTADLQIYSLLTIQKTAHKFTKQCFVHLEHADPNTVLCRLMPKLTLTNLDTLAGDFMNELLDQSLRAILYAETEPVRRLILAQAFSNTNLLHPETDVDESPGFTDSQQ